MISSLDVRRFKGNCYRDPGCLQLTSWWQLPCWRECLCWRLSAELALGGAELGAELRLGAALEDKHGEELTLGVVLGAALGALITLGETLGVAPVQSFTRCITDTGRCARWSSGIG